MLKINNIIKIQNTEFLPKIAEWNVYGNETQGILYCFFLLPAPRAGLGVGSQDF